jgi:hypothetical protein
LGFRSKKAFRLPWGLERLKPHKKISKTGLRWMKETLDFSFWQSKNYWGYIFLLIFISTIYIVKFSIYSFSKLFLSCLLRPSFVSLIWISKGLHMVRLKNYSEWNPHLLFLNLRLLSQPSVQFQWSQVNNMSVKFLSLVIRSTAPVHLYRFTQHDATVYCGRGNWQFTVYYSIVLGEPTHMMKNLKSHFPWLRVEVPM